MKAGVLKFIALVFALLFIVSAVLQYNDPDPLLWYIIYGFAALLAVLFMLDRLPFWMAVLGFVLFFAGGVISWPETFEGVTIGGGDIKNIEEGREALGLFITALVMFTFAWSLRGKKSPA